MVLEPNCSILAACLPTYGPLLSGGRAPESLVRSVRSVFSLRSARSNNASATSLPRSRNKSAGESQVELHDLEVENYSRKVSREVVPPVPSVPAQVPTGKGPVGNPAGGEW
jgi:hypothetical protein